MYDAIVSILGYNGPSVQPVICLIAGTAVLLVIDRLTAFVLGFFKR